tara:strand:+ start:41 stop:895 length:855 start_codon:yes stop_codon:yes gene_type:complete
MTKLKINYTNNVDSFKYLSYNRDVKKGESESHIKKIALKILEKGFRVPIFVKKNREVIDGQHRIEAVKLLLSDKRFNIKSIDIPYIEYKNDEDDLMITLNRDRKDWGFDDFAHYFSTKGNLNYTLFLKLRKEYGLTAFCILQHNRLFGGRVELIPIDKKDKTSKTLKGFIVKTPSGYNESDFKAGKFKLTKESYEKFRDYFGKFIDSDMLITEWKKTYFLRAMIYLKIANKSMNLNTFFKQYSKYPKQWNNGYTEYEHIKNITKLYNYRAKHRKIKYALGMVNK